MSTVAAVLPLRTGDPATLGGYTLLGRLGEGGMGVVYLGRDPHGLLAAIKIIRTQHASDPQFRTRFRREIEAARRVARFCTAAVLDADLDAEQPWLATEYIDGPSLHAAVRDSGPIEGSDLDALAVGVAAALTAIHGAGLVHRDLKPANVLLSPVGPRVIDFGIARAVDATAYTLTGQVIGTPGYMAPEQVSGERVTPAADVFAWGGVVVYAATGDPPFGRDLSVPAAMHRILHADPNLDAVESGLREVVAAAMHKDPAQRPTSSELLEQMRTQVDRTAGAGAAAAVLERATASAGETATVSRPAAPAAPPPKAPARDAGPAPDGQVPDKPAPGRRPVARRLRRPLLAVAALITVLSAALVYGLSNATLPSFSFQSGDLDGGAGDPTSEQDAGDGAATELGERLLPQEVKAAGRVVVGAYATEPAAFPSSTNGEPVGYDVDLARAMGEKLGVDVAFVEVASPDQLLARMEDDSLDLAMGMLPADYLRSEELTAIHHLNVGSSILVPNGNPEAIRSLDDLCGRTVAVPDYLDTPTVERQQARCEEAGRRLDVRVLDPAKSDPLDHVASGAAAATLDDYVWAAYRVRNRTEGLFFEIVGEPLDPAPFGIGVRPEDAQLRDAVVAALEELIADGTYTEVLQAWDIPDAAVTRVEVSNPDG